MLKNPESAVEVAVDIDQLERERIVQNVSCCLPYPWALKFRVDESNQLGIYFYRKDERATTKVTEVKRLRNLLNFHTEIYNFQLENNPPVYEACGIFGFPKSWNYLYGPSKLMDVEALKNSLTSKVLHIKCWLREGLLHSALLHHIALNMQTLMDTATEDDLIVLPMKDLYSLFEWEELRVRSEDSLLLFLGEYAMHHSGDNLNDLLKNIKVNRVSTETLLETMKNVSFNRNTPFVSRTTTELDFRSKLSRSI